MTPTSQAETLVREWLKKTRRFLYDHDRDKLVDAIAREIARARDAALESAGACIASLRNDTDDLEADFCECHNADPAQVLAQAEKRVRALKQEAAVEIRARKP